MRPRVLACVFRGYFACVRFKRSMDEEEFEDRELIKVVKERFMELAKVKFK